MGGRVGLIACLMVCLVADRVQSTQWLGPVSTSGPVAPHPSFLAAVASFHRTWVNFDHMHSGDNVRFTPWGDFYLANTPSSVPLNAASLPELSAEPSSAPIAVSSGEASALCWWG